MYQLVHVYRIIGIQVTISNKKWLIQNTTSIHVLMCNISFDIHLNLQIAQSFISLNYLQ